MSQPQAPQPSLPPPALRKGGDNFASDVDFVQGGQRDTRLLMRDAGLDRNSSVLDWGCGPGRLLWGVLSELGEVRRYVGVDVEKRAIDWARDNIVHSWVEFIRVDAQNDRYNPDGFLGPRIPVNRDSVDVFYAYSVFSHMLLEDTSAYLGEVRRVLSTDGRAFVTAFVEDGVEDCVENPEGYGQLSWEGRLHCVRYDRAFFDRLVADAGLEIVGFVHGEETDGQSRYILAQPSVGQHR